MLPKQERTLEQIRTYQEKTYLNLVIFVFSDFLSVLSMKNVDALIICLKYFYSLENGDNLAYFLDNYHLTSKKLFQLQGEVSNARFMYILKENPVFARFYIDILMGIISIFDNLDNLDNEIRKVKFSMYLKSKILTIFHCHLSSFLTRDMMIQIIHDLMLSGLGKYSSFILQDKDDYYRVSTEAREASAIIVKAAKAKIHWANNIAIITKTD